MMHAPEPGNRGAMRLRSTTMVQHDGKRVTGNRRRRRDAFEVAAEATTTCLAIPWIRSRFNSLFLECDQRGWRRGLKAARESLVRLPCRVWIALQPLPAQRGRLRTAL